MKRVFLVLVFTAIAVTGGLKKRQKTQSPEVLILDIGQDFRLPTNGCFLTDF